MPRYKRRQLSRNQKRKNAKRHQQLQKQHKKAQRAKAPAAKTDGIVTVYFHLDQTLDANNKPSHDLRLLRVDPPSIPKTDASTYVSQADCFQYRVIDGRYEDAQLNPLLHTQAPLTPLISKYLTVVKGLNSTESICEEQKEIDWSGCTDTQKRMIKSFSNLKDFEEYTMDTVLQSMRISVIICVLQPEYEMDAELALKVAEPSLLNEQTLTYQLSKVVKVVFEVEKVLDGDGNVIRYGSEVVHIGEPYTFTKKVGIFFDNVNPWSAETIRLNTRHPWTVTLTVDIDSCRSPIDEYKEEIKRDADFDCLTEEQIHAIDAFDMAPSLFFDNEHVGKILCAAKIMPVILVKTVHPKVIDFSAIEIAYCQNHVRKYLQRMNYFLNPQIKCLTLGDAMQDQQEDFSYDSDSSSSSCDSLSDEDVVDSSLHATAGAVIAGSDNKYDDDEEDDDDDLVDDEVDRNDPSEIAEDPFKSILSRYLPFAAKYLSALCCKEKSELSDDEM